MLGVVSGRAAAILRSTETYPTLADLWYVLNQFPTDLYGVHKNRNVKQFSILRLNRRP